MQVLTAINHHKNKFRVFLGLNKFELWDTRAVCIQWLICAAIAIIALIITFTVPYEKIGLAGYIYFSVFAVQITLARIRAKRLNG